MFNFKSLGHFNELLATALPTNPPILGKNFNCKNFLQIVTNSLYQIVELRISVLQSSYRKTPTPQKSPINSMCAFVGSLSKSLSDVFSIFRYISLKPYKFYWKFAW